MLARSKLNSMESQISEGLIISEICHEDFMTIINEENKYWELKKSIRMMYCQRSDNEKIHLFEKDKEIGIDEVIEPNEIINKILKY